MTSTHNADAAWPVQKQLDAYNARDIDGFMQWWAEDCEYYEFPARLLARGKAAVRARHLARFEEANLHGRLVHRMSVGDVVVDHETVVRSFPEGPGEVDVIAIYEVAGGKIAKAWFKMGAARLHAPGTVTIRPAALRDLATIRILTHAAYSKWVAVMGRKPLPMTADHAEALQRHRVELLHLDGEPVGLIDMIPSSDHLQIDNIAVAPEFQGRGFGRVLLAHAEQVARELGHGEMRLYTNKLMGKNIALYLGLGYRIDREEAFMDGFTVYMSKPV